MNAPASNNGGVRSGSATTSQAQGNSGREEDAPQQATLEAFARHLSAIGRDTGERRTAEADPDGLARVLQVIAGLAAEGWTFTSADVRSRVGPGFGAVMGAAFHTARRQGLIEAVGVETSKSITRHGSLVRTWRQA